MYGCLVHEDIGGEPRSLQVLEELQGEVQLPREFLENPLGALQGAQNITRCIKAYAYTLLGALQGAHMALKKFPTADRVWSTYAWFRKKWLDRAG